MFLGWDGPVMPDSGLLLTMLSHGLVAFTIEFDSIGLAGMARPTSKGQKAQCLYRELTHEIKERWRTRVRTLRESLANVVDVRAQTSQAFSRPGALSRGWRAS